MVSTSVQRTPVKIRLSVPLLLLLLIGAGAELHGQQQPSAGDDPGPITTLLGLQVELGITDEQAERLREIDGRMDGVNQPLVGRLMEIRGRIHALGSHREMTPENRALFESYVAEARPLMRQINDNNKAAMREVGDVLTREQKDTIARLLKERYENRDRSGRTSRSRDRGN
jgi:hypothetical protein